MAVEWTHYHKYNSAGNTRIWWWKVTPLQVKPFHYYLCGWLHASPSTHCSVQMSVSLRTRRSSCLSVAGSLSVYQLEKVICSGGSHPSLDDLFIIELPHRSHQYVPTLLTPDFLLYITAHIWQTSSFVKRAAWIYTAPAYIKHFVNSQFSSLKCRHCLSSLVT